MKLKRFIGMGMAAIMALSNVNMAFAEKTADAFPNIADETVSDAGVYAKLEAYVSHSSTDTVYPVEGGNIYIRDNVVVDADKSITSAVIPNSVTSIGNVAFYGCSSLTSINIPDSVTSIGSGAFDLCSSLTSINIPDGVTSIDDYAFFGCSSLTSINIPDSVTYINKYAFDGCDKTKLTMHVDKGSYAEQYAIGNGWKYDHNVEEAPDPIVDPSQGQATSLSGIKSVNLSSNGKAYNILTSKFSVKKGSNTAVTINVDVDWKNRTPGNIYLTQDAAHSLSSSNGTFANIVPENSFDSGDAIYVIAMDSSGKTVDKRRIYLLVVDETLSGDIGFDKTSFKLFDGFSFTIPDDKPVLGNQEFKFDFGSFGINMYNDLEKQTFKGTIGVNLETDPHTGNASPKDFTDFKNIFKDIKKNQAKGMKYIERNAFMRNRGYKRLTNNFTIMKGWTPEGNILGYVEGVYINGKPYISEGGIILIVEGKYTYQGQTFVGPVPIYYTIGAGGKVTGTFGIKDMVADGFQPKFTGTLEIAPYFEVSGGVGVVYLAQIGARGRATLTAKIALDHNYQKVDLTGQAYFEVKALSFLSYERQFAKGTWVIYETGRTNVYSADDVPDFNDIYSNIDINAKIRPENRSYASKSTNWLGENTNAVKAYEYTNKELKVLQTNAYPDAQPQIMEANGKKVMLWLTDNTSRDAYNKSMLVYSVYDESNNTWSAPQAIMDNGTADYYPSAKDGYVVWQKATRQYSENDTLASVAKDTEIYVSKFNGTSFDMPTRITNNSVMDTQPHIAVNGNKAFVVWTQNTDNNILGISGKNSVYSSEFDGTTWSEPVCVEDNLNIIASLDTDYMNDGFVTAYSLDTDNNINTVDDREIYIIKNGNTTRFTENEYIDSNPTFADINGSTALFWYSDNELVYVTDLNDPIYNSVTVAEDSELGDEFSVISKGNRTAVLWTATQDGVSEVYGSLYDGKQWSNDVEITTTGQNARYPNGVIDENGKLIIAFNRIQNIVDGDYYKDGQADLCVINVIPSYDLEIGELYMADSIIPNSEIPVLFDVTNTGEMPVDKINVEIIDVDGTTNYSQDFDQPLQPGETAEISAIYKTGETIVSGKISANISTTSGKEEDLNNNTATAEIGLADIEIEDISIKKNGDKYNVTVTVINSGYKDVSNVDVAISTDTEGESVIATQSIEAISAQDKKILNFVVDPASINTEDDVIVLNTVLSTSTEEANKGNNYKGFILEETPDKASFVFGDADGDNAVTAGDAAYVLQKALISTFELPLQEKTDDWLKYADADADNKITASDSAFILQKALVSTFELPAETIVNVKNISTFTI